VVIIEIIQFRQEEDLFGSMWAAVTSPTRPYFFSFLFFFYTLAIAFSFSARGLTRVAQAWMAGSFIIFAALT
jgi:hypothetical protein